MFQGDEQPFDPGELNVFAEDLTLSRIATKHLRRLRIKPDTTILNLRVSSWASVVRPRTSNLYEITERCITECKDLVEGVLTRSSGSMFLDPFLDNSLVQICQRLSVFDCLSGFVTTSCRSQAQDLFSFLSQVECRTVFMDSVLESFERILGLSVRRR